MSQIFYIALPSLALGVWLGFMLCLRLAEWEAARMTRLNRLQRKDDYKI